MAIYKNGRHALTLVRQRMPDSEVGRPSILGSDAIKHFSILHPRMAKKASPRLKFDKIVSCIGIDLGQIYMDSENIGCSSPNPKSGMPYIGLDVYSSLEFGFTDQDF